MPDSIAFTTICEELEATSTLDRLEARGTVRISLKQAGLDAAGVTPSQLQVVVEKILPGELETRGVDAVADICSKLTASLKSLPDEQSKDSPEAVFQRLGG